MNKLTKPLALAALLAGIGFSAVAQVPPAAPHQGQPAAAERHAHRGERGEHHGRRDPAEMRQRMEERMAKHHAELKQKLQISGAQENAWAAWTSAMKPPARPAQREDLSQLSTPERMDRMRALRNARAAEMDRRMEATKSFYASLNAEQKKVFDSETARMHRHGGRGGEHGGRHRG